MGITHAAIGAMVGYQIADWPGAGIGAIAALLPDIDHPQSLLGRRLWPVAWTINQVMGHRGALHSLAALLLVSAAASVMLPDWWIVIAAGYASHLAADALTVSGVPLLWPIRARIRLLGIRTGGIIEHAINVLLCVLLVQEAVRWMNGNL